MSRKNGGIIGPANTPVGGIITGVASGVWRTNDLLNFVANNQWPTTPQNIENSCRFDDGSSDNLTRTPSSASNRDTFTFSFWVKRSNISSNQSIITARSDGSNYFTIRFEPDDLHIFDLTSGSFAYQIKTNQLFRDISAWYHIVIAFDTTQGTAADRIKIYVNGSQVTSFASASYPSQNTDQYINNTVEHQIGKNGSGDFFDGYMAEFVFVDGQQLDPTSFGETNTATGIWTPKKIGSIANAGNNSFYLDFKDSSNLGNDASGLNNDFTVNNLTSIDQSTDTCVENFATFNSLIPNTNITYSQGNLDILRDSGGDNRIALSSIAVSSGKWYVEMKCVQNQDHTHYGIVAADSAYSTSNSLAQMVNAFAYKNDGTVQEYNQSNIDTGEATFTTGDIIGIALDMDNNKLYFHKNGTYLNSGDPAGNSNGYSITADKEYYFASAQNYATGKTSANFGSPSFSISSGNSDGNGYGNFEYSVPSGYYALNTSNLNTYG